MAKKRRYTADYILLIVLVAVVAVLLVYMLKRYHLNDEVVYEPNLDVVANPMMGYAPYAENLDACDQANLVFIKLKWSDWEPEMGYYDTGYLESQFHLARWKAAGKHGVLRFICTSRDRRGTQIFRHGCSMQPVTAPITHPTAVAGIPRNTGIPILSPGMLWPWLLWPTISIRMIFWPMWNWEALASGENGMPETSTDTP